MMLGSFDDVSASDIDPIDYSLIEERLNESQKLAVDSALTKKLTLVKGPPGSGKTTVIHEMILQLIDKGNYPILVVATSNLAIDNVAEKLMNGRKRVDMVRVPATLKDYPESHKLGPICLHNIVKKQLSIKDAELYERIIKEEFEELTPDEYTHLMSLSTSKGKAILGDAKVILSTVISAASSLLKTVENFPVVIMDEANFCSEPHSLVPLSVPGVNKLVLVGDEKQLGMNTTVKSFGFSFFEKALKLLPESKPIMLNVQYRMHPQISEFPRLRFYDDLLKDGVTRSDRHSKKIKYPVYFYDYGGKTAATEHKMKKKPKTKHHPMFRKKRKEGVEEEEEQEYSFVNYKEAALVTKIVNKLIFDLRIPPDRIGVISSYSCQRDVIMSMINFTSRVEERRKVMVATIDAFQGREKDIVVMSCVRSNPESRIGFMNNQRRMNVALTRAKYCMVLVGNALCLENSSSVWKEYIEYLDDRCLVFKLGES
ncbi:unnamed protein product [Ambrosiozyma monospora]|uniref:Unnamed protein product n=1 Tax=Ambrosiozyma monospora TaxID=43982 RepID=A0A9W6YWC7_AMBMO|nr:unnamed protein product [Ambrosiozyma monospora]